MRRNQNTSRGFSVSKRGHYSGKASGKRTQEDAEISVKAKCKDDENKGDVVTYLSARG